MICTKSNCSGCHACANVCPTKCITMQPDKEGFCYPKIDKKKCVHCDKCKDVCQVINPIRSKSIPKVYAAYNNDENIRYLSSSGGVFTVIAQEIIDKGGLVFGAAFDSDLSVHHIWIEKKEDIKKLRKSKYVQSTIGTAYTEVKKRLDDGKYVLFTGTPCQIDGLIHYLGKEYPKLYTQDIICHGVPSPIVWKKYLDYQCGVHCTELDLTEKPDFRSKDKGWTLFSLKLYFSDGETYSKMFGEDLYMRAFLNNICLRPSCYDCKSKSLNRNSDITLADFWGIENIDETMFDNKGTSLIFVNTDKGKELLLGVQDKMTITEENVEDAIKYNSAAYRSVELNRARKKFMKLIRKKTFDKAFSVVLKPKTNEVIRSLLHHYKNKFRQ